MSYLKIIITICFLFCATCTTSQIKVEEETPPIKGEENLTPYLYANDQIGFSIDYPADMKVTTPIPGVIQFKRNQELCFNIRMVPFNEEGSKLGFAGRVLNARELTKEEHLLTAVSQAYRGCEPDYAIDNLDLEAKSLAIIEPVTIGNQEGLQASGSLDACLDQYLPISLLIYQDTRFFFEKVNGSKEEYQQMLASFTFLDNL